MMQTTADSSSTKELIISIFLGLFIGGVTTLFIKGLQLIEFEHDSLNIETWPLHLFFIPIVLYFLYLLKKRTLFFPNQVSDLTAWTFESCMQWNPLMSIFHIFGTLLSHLVGVSLGKEDAVVLISSGFVRLFKLNWRFWGPIAIGSGFSAVLGVPWIGLIFIGELFKTQIKQKIFLLISSLFAYLLMQTLQVQHLIIPIEIHDQTSFFIKVFFILSLSISVGFMMRLYKWCLINFKNFLQKKSFLIRLVLSLGLMGLLIIPQLRKYQSLGILQLQDLNHLQLGYQIPFAKLCLTFISVSLGFWGGDFFSLVYAGLHYGATLAQHFGITQIFGAYLASYLFFAGATRMKWTAYFLILSLVGWSWWLWLIILINLTVGFSGSESLYRSYE